MSIINSKTRAESYGANVGIGKTTKNNNTTPNYSAGVNGSNTNADKSWVGNQTTIIGKNSVKVNANTMKNKGAVIAQVGNYDEMQEKKNKALEDLLTSEGLDDASDLSAEASAKLSQKFAEIDATSQDGGNLEINVKNLVVENIYDKDESYTYGGGVSRSKGATSLSFNDDGHDKEQTTFATIGNGKITVDGKDYENENLNRDINKTQEITKDEKTGGYNVTVSVDDRVFTEEGRKQMKEELKTEIENITNIADNSKAASMRAGKSIKDVGYSIKTSVTEDGVNLFDVKKLYDKATDENVQAQINHKNKELRDKINNTLGEDGEKSAEEVKKDLKDVANVLRKEEGAGEGELYLYEGNKLSAEGECDEKGLSKKEASAYHDADNSDIAINVDKTDLTASATLYGVLNEEAEHAAQKARGEKYDSDDGVNGSSETWGEFANQTAKSAWELENKLAGISNSSNSSLMSTWKTNNSGNTTLTSGTNSAERAQDIQPEVLIPVEKRLANANDVSYNKNKPFYVYKYVSYDFDSPEEYLNAAPEERAKKIVGETELAFDNWQNEEKGSILGSTEVWKDIYTNPSFGKEDVDYKYGIRNIGETGVKITTSDNVTFTGTMLHVGGPAKSAGCGTSVNNKYYKISENDYTRNGKEAQKLFEQDLRQLIEQDNTTSDDYILLPAK